MERLPKHLHASVRRTLRQAWELDDAAKAEQLNPQPGAAAGTGGALCLGDDPGGDGRTADGGSLKLQLQLRRCLACTNIIETMMGSIRRVCGNVKHWRDAAMARPWTGAAMQEAAKGLRRLKAHKQLPVLRAALASLKVQNASDTALATAAAAA